jgi:autotransporter strand-loop-strand O-heptosyltransferase
MVEFIEDDKQFNDFFLSNQSFYKKTDTDYSFVYCNQSTRNRLTKLQNKNTFEEKLVGFYRDITFTEKRKVNKIQISTHCVRGPFVEINADASRIFEVSFLDVNGRPIHVSNINGNMWTRLNHKFYYDYSVVVKENGQVIYQNKLDLKGKRVYIAIESSSLGDSIAWFPYAEEFRKKHECELLVSTFNNSFFIENYPDITFVSPGEQVHNLTAMYSIGWFYNEEGELDYTKCPTDFRNQPLQKTASDILGLEYREIRPIISYPKKQKTKRVGIAIHGTAQSKYWNNKGGWQEVTDHLKSLGYEVVLYSKEEDGYMGNSHPVGINKFPSGPLSNLIEDLATCEFFIGIGSGLSWLAWALNLPVVLISGFSKDFTETVSNTWRIINNDVCTGCFNTHRLNASDWNWCPMHKDTERQFECTKQITPKMVISKIDDLIKSNQ